MTYERELRETAKTLVAPRKGILAADESIGTIGKRFAKLGIPSTAETHRMYRDMLFTTPGIEEYISGVILFDETIRQESLGGTLFPKLLAERGIIPGIKVDTGTTDMALHPAEKVTQGLDGLRERLAEYRSMGAQFTKWRAVITIGAGIPTQACVAANAHDLARYAALAQEAGLVPIVEPEVLMDGDHDQEQCEVVTTRVLGSVFKELARQGVLLEGMLLKPSMVISGKACVRQAGVEEVAEATVRTLRRTVPAAVPGIVFLSGGQSSEVATAHLNAMNKMGPHPWELSYSYGRALQEPALTIWHGDEANVGAAQKAFHHRAMCNSAARAGAYTAEMEQAE
ncbi:MAG TPA: fructose-bisphosphate aldolase class I [Candidatus Cryosericum sp.]|nr:fructose-bisphosphate aldolase class I [Candidatus Cryosericum sp.]